MGIRGRLVFITLKDKKPASITEHEKSKNHPVPDMTSLYSLRAIRNATPIKPPMISPIRIFLINDNREGAIGGIGWSITWMKGVLLRRLKSAISAFFKTSTYIAVRAAMSRCKRD